MRVPGFVYADEPLMAPIQRDGSLEQVANAASLPGILKASLAMPDVHQGYGLPGATRAFPPGHPELPAA